MKFSNLIKSFCFLLFLLSSCKFRQAPGLQFDLMENTPIWPLAKAVESEDTAEIRKLVQEKHLDLNYKERNSEIGITLLHLAVRNGKLLSIKSLLENGARQNIRDSSGNFPINDIVNMSFPFQHRLEILELLLRYGADPNSQVKGYRWKDTIPFQVGVPLTQAVANLECTKLLMKYGADVYYKKTQRNFLDSCQNYPVWGSVFSFSGNNVDENIMVAKFFVLDKHLLIPNPLYYRGYNTEYDIRPVTALDILNKATFADPAKQKAKEEILAYLKKEGFPEHGSIPNPPPRQ